MNEALADALSHRFGVEDEKLVELYLMMALYIGGMVQGMVQFYRLPLFLEEKAAIKKNALDRLRVEGIEPGDKDHAAVNYLIEQAELLCDR